MNANPFMKKCCIDISQCSGKIEFHHNLIYAGRQVNEAWCILPLCKTCHDNIVSTKPRCNWIMCNRATDEELRHYSKAIDYIALRDRLNGIYGKYE